MMWLTSTITQFLTDVSQGTSPYFSKGWSRKELKNSFNKFVLNYHDVLDTKYSMEEINKFNIFHFS